MLITPDMVGKELYLVLEEEESSYWPAVYLGKPGMGDIDNGKQRTAYMKEHGWTTAFDPETQKTVFVDPEDGSWWDATNFNLNVWQAITERWQLRKLPANVREWQADSAAVNGQGETV